MKLLASDFDGTLHFEDGYHKEDLEAIKKFQEAGHLFGLCSGRPLGNLQELEEEGLRFDFIIGSSGAAFSDHGKIVYEETIPQEVFEKIYTLMKGHHLFVSTTENMYALKEDLAFLTGWVENTIDLSDPQLTEKEKIVHVSIEYESLEPIEKLLSQLNALKDEVEFYQNGPSIDFVPKGYSKHIGIEKAAAYYGLKEEDIRCIGDNYNDLPMLEGIKESYTFDFAPDAVRDKAGHVVHSLAQCIERLMEEENENTCE